MNAANQLAINMAMAAVAKGSYSGGSGDLTASLTIIPLGKSFFGMPGIRQYNWSRNLLPGSDVLST